MAKKELTSEEIRARLDKVAKRIGFGKVSPREDEEAEKQFRQSSIPSPEALLRRYGE